MTRFGTPALALAVAAGLLGCGNGGGARDDGSSPDGGGVDGAPREPAVRQLVDHTAWQPLPPSEDPLFALRDGNVVCPATEWGLEDDFDPSLTPAPDAPPVLEVHTEICNYLTLAQPSLYSIRRGDTVRARVWHNLLDKDLPSGTIAIAIDGEIAWEQEVSLRSAAEAFEPSWTADREHPVGAPIWFHVRNHGKNSYKTDELVAVTPGG